MKSSIVGIKFLILETETAVLGEGDKEQSIETGDEVVETDEAQEDMNLIREDNVEGKKKPKRLIP